MKRNLLSRFLLIAFIVTWALWELYPPQPRDLIEVFETESSNRDTNFDAIVEQAHHLQKANPQRAYFNLREAIGTNNLTRYFPTVKIKEDSDATRTILQRIQKDAAGKIRLGLDLQGGTSFLVELDTSKLDTNNLGVTTERRSLVLAQAIEVLRKRVDKFGVAEPILQAVSNDRIEIQLPGLSETDKEGARTTISKVAFLEFRLVHERNAEQLASGLIDPGYEILSTKRRGKDGQPMVQRYVVNKKPEKGLTGNYVSRAGVEPDPITNQPRITLRFNNQGAELFGEITKKNIGRQLAIVLDGELYSAPVIEDAITGGSAVIRGDFTLKEAFELANVLENPLEAPVKLLSERSVEPSLGKDNIRSGVIASVIGTAAVSGFMLVYYLFSGLVANIALITNIIILLGVMCSVGTTLTLPGIAGVVLTIGMAVDANVLIYERIREELGKGKSLRGALSAGYDKAFTTIFDSHVTTLISSVILIFMGTGSIKGFGVALTIGVAASLFTALVVTRLIFDWMLSKSLLKSLRMLHIIRASKLDFMRFAKPAFTISWLLILIGISYGFYRGKSAFGVDFMGGENLVLKFDQNLNVDNYREKVRKAVRDSGAVDSVVQFQNDLSSGLKSLRITTPIDFGQKAEDALVKQFPEAKFERIQLDKVGATVGKEIQKSALIASLLSLFGILIYVAFRYEFAFGVGAVVAVVHDVLMTLGWYFLAGREFNATMVAAVLTIIGFSVNDTIVIFDRIREDLKLGIRGTFRELINQALNQTLSRTIITSGTVFLATMALYLFGGGAINDFAFTFLVGIITGTYSSIYIASALVLWWHKGERPGIGSGQVVIDETETARV